MEDGQQLDLCSNVYVAVEKLMNKALLLHEDTKSVRVVHPTFFCEMLVGRRPRIKQWYRLCGLFSLPS